MLKIAHGTLTVDNISMPETLRMSANLLLGTNTCYIPRGKGGGALSPFMVGESIHRKQVLQKLQSNADFVHMLLRIPVKHI